MTETTSAATPSHQTEGTYKDMTKQQPPSQWLVEVNGRQYAAPSLEVLAKWVQLGKVAKAHLVFDPVRNVWKPAGEMAELIPHFTTSADVGARPAWGVEVQGRRYRAASLDDLRRWAAEGRFGVEARIFHPPSGAWIAASDADELRDIWAGAGRRTELAHAHVRPEEPAPSRIDVQRAEVGTGSAARHNNAAREPVGTREAETESDAHASRAVLYAPALLLITAVLLVRFGWTAVRANLPETGRPGALLLAALALLMLGVTQSALLKGVSEVGANAKGRPLPRPDTLRRLVLAMTFMGALATALCAVVKLQWSPYRVRWSELFDARAVLDHISVGTARFGGPQPLFIPPFHLYSLPLALAVAAAVSCLIVSVIAGFHARRLAAALRGQPQLEQYATTLTAAGSCMSTFVAAPLGWVLLAFSNVFLPQASVNATAVRRLLNPSASARRLRVVLTAAIVLVAGGYLAATTEMATDWRVRRLALKSVAENTPTAWSRVNTGGRGMADMATFSLAEIELMRAGYIAITETNYMKDTFDAQGIQNAPRVPDESHGPGHVSWPMALSVNGRYPYTSYYLSVVLMPKANPFARSCGGDCVVVPLGSKRNIRATEVAGSAAHKEVRVEWDVEPNEVGKALGMKKETGSAVVQVGHNMNVPVGWQNFGCGGECDAFLATDRVAGHSYVANGERIFLK